MPKTLSRGTCAVILSKCVNFVTLCALTECFYYDNERKVYIYSWGASNSEFMV